jgi:type VI secretion system protein ImpK
MSETPRTGGDTSIGMARPEHLVDLCVPIFNLGFEIQKLSEGVDPDAVAPEGEADLEPDEDDIELDGEEEDDFSSIGITETLLWAQKADLSKAVQAATQKMPSDSKFDADNMRGTVAKLFDDLDNAARRNGIQQEHVRRAKYALCAYLDELVLSSPLEAKESWSGRPLQLQYFNDYTAGEEFYNKLDALRNTDQEHKRQALEVFFMCLCFGFRGKYGDAEGMEQRKVLIDKLAREIAGHDDDAAVPLSPSWEPGEVREERKSKPLWLLAALGLSLAVGAYVVLRLMLESEIADILN